MVSPSTVRPTRPGQLRPTRILDRDSGIAPARHDSRTDTGRRSLCRRYPGEPADDTAERALSTNLEHDSRRSFHPVEPDPAVHDDLPATLFDDGCWWGQRSVRGHEAIREGSAVGDGNAGAGAPSTRVPERTTTRVHPGQASLSHRALAMAGSPPSSTAA